MVEALVLNATFEPLCVVSQRRAVVLVLAEKAVVVEAGEGALHGPSVVLPIPAVVRLARFVRVPYRAEVPLTRKGVLVRDGHRCVYCGATATSLDHVDPSQPRRPPCLGKRRRRLQPLQPREGRPKRRRPRLADALRSSGSERFRLAGAWAPAVPTRVGRRISRGCFRWPSAPDTATGCGTRCSRHRPPPPPCGQRPPTCHAREATRSGRERLATGPLAVDRHYES